MPSAALRAMMGTKRPKFGTFVIEFDSPGMGQILKAAGCEYALLDLEHSGFGYDQLKRMLRFYQAADLPVIVSTVGGDYDMVALRSTWGRTASSRPRSAAPPRPAPSSITSAMRPRARGGWLSASPTTATVSARRRRAPRRQPGRGLLPKGAKRPKQSTRSKPSPRSRSRRHLDRPFRPFGRHGHSGEVRSPEIPGGHAARRCRLRATW